MATPCRACGAEIPPKHVNESRRYATCPRCHAVTDLASADTALAVRGEVTLPGGYEVITPPSDAAQGFRDAASRATPVVVRWRWRTVERTGDVAMLVLFALFWNILCGGAFVASLLQRVWGGAAFLSLFLGAGWMVGKIAAEKLLNRTTLALGADTLTLRVRPIARDRDRTLPVREIERFYCVDRSGEDGPTNFALVARLRSGAEVVLADELLAPEQVFCLASLLEQKMRLHEGLPPGEP